MQKEFNQPLFESTFTKHKELLKSKLNLKEGHYDTEPRDEKGRVDRPDAIKYEIVKTKGEVSKIIAELSGNMSGGMTNAINKFQRVNELLEEVEKINEEIKQEGIREKIASLFGAEYEFCTRVIRTVSAWQIVLTKQPKAAETVKWAKVIEELSGQLTPELVKVLEAITKKYTTTQEPKPPGLKIEPIAEGIGDMWSSFLGKIKQWGSLFDRRLDKVMNTLTTATPTEGSIAEQEHDDDNQDMPYDGEGTPGDGTGTDDLADYNAAEADDYRGEMDEIEGGAEDELDSLEFPDAAPESPETAEFEKDAAAMTPDASDSEGIYDVVTLQQDAMGSIHMWTGDVGVRRLGKYKFVSDDGREADVYLQSQDDVDAILNALSPDEKTDLENGHEVITKNVSDEYFMENTNEDLLKEMKTYIVYVDGEEQKEYIKAGSHNAAEAKAKKKYQGKDVSVAYTEI